jgi:hypothetical protein
LEKSTLTAIQNSYKNQHQGNSGGSKEGKNKVDSKAF